MASVTSLPLHDARTSRNVAPARDSKIPGSRPAVAAPFRRSEPNAGPPAGDKMVGSLHRMLKETTRADIGHHAVRSAGWGAAGITAYLLSSAGGALGQPIGLRNAGEILGAATAYPFGEQINAYALQVANNWFPQARQSGGQVAPKTEAKSPIFMV